MEGIDIDGKAQQGREAFRNKVWASKFVMSHMTDVTQLNGTVMVRDGAQVGVRSFGVGISPCVVIASLLLVADSVVYYKKKRNKFNIKTARFEQQRIR